MKRAETEKGFSLLEVMIAGSLMMIIVLGIFQLIVNAQKSTGDLEKRQRHHDLVDDIRFALSPTLCRHALQVPSWTENAEAEIHLNGKAVVRTGAMLNDYGIRVTRLYLKNVQPLATNSETETTIVADLYLEAAIIGSNRPLKPVKVSRLLHTRLANATEGGCYGSHDMMSRNFSPGTEALDKVMAAAVQKAQQTPPGTPGGMPVQIGPDGSPLSGVQGMPTPDELKALVQSGFDMNAFSQKLFQDAEFPADQNPGNAPAPSAGTPSVADAAAGTQGSSNRSENDCPLDPDLQRQASRFRIIQGEVHRYRNSQQQLVELTCRNGSLSSVIIDESRGSP